MAIRIAGAHNPVNQINFEVELDGGEVLAFTVPKAQYIAKPVMDEYETWFMDWQTTAMSTTKTAEKARAKMHDYDPMLKLFEMVLPADVYVKIAALTRGELQDLDRNWTEMSGITLGESAASAAS